MPSPAKMHERMGVSAPGGEAERAVTAKHNDKMYGSRGILSIKTKEEGDKLISEVPSDRTRGSGHKLKHKRFPLKVRKHHCTGRVVELCHRLPEEAVESTSLHILKRHLDLVLGSLLELDGGNCTR